MKDFVYVISGDHGRQKIGSSDDPARRIKELQTGSPYALRFEFIGQCEAGSGGQIEVGAHYALNQHKSPGGDEWFAVPPDIAMTAVMASAHRLGYRVVPVDPSAIRQVSFETPTWHRVCAVIAALPMVALWIVLARSSADGFTLALGAVILLAIWKVARWVLIKIVGSFVELDRAMHPDGGPKVPLPD